MKTLRHFTLTLIALTGLAFACTQAENNPADTPQEADSPVVDASPETRLTTFILVRHAEKAQDGTQDPALTEKGQARAQLLADMLAETDLAAIYTTPYQRNRQTVAVAAGQSGLTPNEYDPGQAPEAFIREVWEAHYGQHVLVAGHSNTVPHLLNALVGEARYEDLPDSAYNNLFIVTLTAPGKATVTPLQFKP